MAAEFLAAHPEGGWLDPVTAAEVLQCFGLPIMPLQAVTSPAEAAEVALQIGGPVALKAAGVLHKTDVGGVRLGLTSPEAAAAAYEEMVASVAAAGQDMAGAHVQAMTPPGVETIAGIVRDPGFGPLVMFGIGGVAAELVGDTALKVAPLTDQDAAELVRGLRSSALLFGYRGAAPTDTPALEDLLLRLSVLGGQLPELAELDLNPVIARPDGVVAVDWRMRLAPVQPDPARDLRRLR